MNVSGLRRKKPSRRRSRELNRRGTVSDDTVVVDITVRLNDQTEEGVEKIKRSMDRLGESIKRTRIQMEKFDSSTAGAKLGAGRQTENFLEKVVHSADGLFDGVLPFAFNATNAMTDPPDYVFSPAVSGRAKDRSYDDVNLKSTLFEQMTQVHPQLSELESYIKKAFNAQAVDDWNRALKDRAVEALEVTREAVKANEDEMDGFKKGIEKADGLLAKFGSRKAKADLSVRDNATAVIRKAVYGVESLAGKTISFTLKALDKATKPIKKLFDFVTSINGVVTGLLVRNSLKTFFTDPMMNANSELKSLASRISGTFDVAVVKKWGNGLQKGALRVLKAVDSHLRENIGWVNKMGNDLKTLGERISVGISNGVDRAFKSLKRLYDDPDFQSSGLFGKLSVAWDEVIKKPFASWWRANSKSFREKGIQLANTVGEGIGSALNGAAGFLFGADVVGATDSAVAMGRSFAEGFVKGFNLKEILKNTGSAIKSLFADVLTMLPGGKGTSNTALMSAGILGYLGTKLGVFRGAGLILGKLPKLFGRGVNLKGISSGAEATSGAVSTGTKPKALTGAISGGPKNFSALASFVTRTFKPYTTGDAGKTLGIADMPNGNSVAVKAEDTVLGKYSYAGIDGPVGSIKGLRDGSEGLNGRMSTGTEPDLKSVFTDHYENVAGRVSNGRDPEGSISTVLSKEVKVDEIKASNGNISEPEVKHSAQYQVSERAAATKAYNARAESKGVAGTIHTEQATLRGAAGLGAKAASQAKGFLKDNWISLLMAGIEIATAKDKPREMTVQTGGIAGSTLGAKLGGLVGAAVTSYLGGVGAVPGAFIGSMVGYAGGTKAFSMIYDSLKALYNRISGAENASRPYGISESVAKMEEAEKLSGAVHSLENSADPVTRIREYDLLISKDTSSLDRLKAQMDDLNRNIGSGGNADELLSSLGALSEKYDELNARLDQNVYARDMLMNELIAQYPTLLADYRAENGYLQESLDLIQQIYENKRKSLELDYRETHAEALEGFHESSRRSYNRFKSATAELENSGKEIDKLYQVVSAIEELKLDLDDVDLRARSGEVSPADARAMKFDQVFKYNDVVEGLGISADSSLRMPSDSRTLAQLIQSDKLSHVLETTGENVQNRLSKQKEKAVRSREDIAEVEKFFASGIELMESEIRDFSDSGLGIKDVLTQYGKRDRSISESLYNDALEAAYAVEWIERNIFNVDEGSTSYGQHISNPSDHDISNNRYIDVVVNEVQKDMKHSRDRSWRAKEYAQGGFINGPHLGLVGEAGPEMVIPLSSHKRNRGLELWNRTGQMLKADKGTHETYSSVQVRPSVTVNMGDILFAVNVPSGDPEDIVRVVREKIPEMTGDIAQQMAMMLSQSFSNIPLD